MNVLLVCLCGIAGCVALVFAVETLVAFCFHEGDQPATPRETPSLSLLLGREIEDVRTEAEFERAA